MKTTAVFKTTRSRYLEILLNNPDINSLSEEEMRKRIAKIMADLDKDGIFDSIKYGDKDVWDDDLDTMSDIQFDENRTPKEKNIALEFLRKPEEKTQREENEEVITLESLKRIREKRRELAQHPESKIVLDDNDFEEEERALRGIAIMPNSYGRNPLHEALGMRNLEMVEKLVSEQKYLDGRDNNSNTPYQMAVQEGYKEAIEIFERANVAV